MSCVGLIRARTLCLILSALAGAVLLLSGASGASAASFKQNPILFVHGIEGSGAQFENPVFTGTGFINIPASPAILQQPKSLSAYIDSSATFTVR